MTAQRPARLRRFGQPLRWGAAIALGAGYSVLSHLAAASAAPGLLDAGVAVAPLAALAALLAWRSPRRPLMLALCLAACALFFGAGDWLVRHYNWIFLLQHAGMYALLGAAFGRTLQGGQTPLVSRLARVVHGELSPALARYTRSVTLAWTCYFGGVAALSLALFWLAPVRVWSVFANLLGAPLLALMFIVEYAVRCCVLPAADRAGLIEAIGAWRLATSQHPSDRP